jgi:hypothetical protein
MKGKPIVERSTNAPAQQGIEFIPSQDLAWLMLMSLVMLSAVMAQVYAYVPKLGRRQSAGSKSRHEDMCHRCQYFNNNLYLKCAIHPGTVLTEASIDCKDYCPKQ